MLDMSVSYFIIITYSVRAVSDGNTQGIGGRYYDPPWPTNSLALCSPSILGHT